MMCRRVMHVQRFVTHDYNIIEYCMLYIWIGLFFSLFWCLLGACTLKQRLPMPPPVRHGKQQRGQACVHAFFPCNSVARRIMELVDGSKQSSDCAVF